MEALPDLGLYRRLTALALVVGPALFLLDNLLHPKEVARGHEAQQLDAIGSAYTRWQVAHAVGLLSAVALAIGARRTVPVWAATALGLGGVLVAIEGLIAHNWYFVASAAVLLVGGAAVGFAISRMDDRAFAGA